MIQKINSSSELNFKNNREKENKSPSNSKDKSQEFLNLLKQSEPKKPVKTWFANPWKK
jgi:hypothetical protein